MVAEEIIYGCSICYRFGVTAVQTSSLDPLSCAEACSNLTALMLLSLMPHTSNVNVAIRAKVGSNLGRDNKNADLPLVDKWERQMYSY
jgi:hypothetical protein